MIDVLIEKYVALRDRKAMLEAEHKTQIAPIKDALDKIEAVLLNSMNEQGTTAFKAAAGTAFKSTKTGARLADWDSYRLFLDKQSDPYRFIDRRVNKTAVDEYVAEHGDVPPGVDYYTELTVNVRRAA